MFAGQWLLTGDMCSQHSTKPSGISSLLQQMKKFKKFLDKKKKMSSVSEEERFMYEVRTLHADLITIIAYLRMCAMPHVYFDTAVHAIYNIYSTIGRSIADIYTTEASYLPKREAPR